MMRRTTRSPFAALRSSARLLALAVPSLAVAPAAVVAQPVVQPTGPGAVSPSTALNSALTRLARDPRNLTALIDAGTAAMQLGDTDAAVGFFSRANEIAPGNGQVKAQIATAMLKADQPLDAIRYFDEAQAAGADLSMFAADRGLAYDLVGDNAAAQRLYQQAMARGSSDELIRRHALSLAIAGDRRGAEAMLAPLIQRQDRAGWRARTFVMAITGSPDEAVSVANASMPAELAGGIAPYLRFMPRLTPAQQAAAANLGRFPRAADIGRDDPKIAQYAALHPPAPRVDQGLIPAGEALGGKGTQVARREKRRRPGREQQVAMATAPRGAPALAMSGPASTTGSAPVSGQAATTLAAPVPAQPATASVAVPVVQPTPASRGGAPWGVQPSGQLAAATPGGASLVPPVAGSSPSAAALPTRSGSGSAGYPLARLDLPPGSAAPPRVTSIPVTRAPSASAAATTASAPVPVTPAPVPVPAPAPVRTASAEAVPPAADFRALFEGFRAPEEEQRSTVAAVDLSTIRSRARPAEPKVAPKPLPVVAVKDVKDAKDARSGGRGAARGERPDGPTAVSRTTEREVRVAQVEDEPEAKPGRGAKGGKASAKDVAKDAAKDTKTAKNAGKDTKTAKDAKDAKAAKAKATPSHPSRIWVQVLTGGNRDQMGKEWRGLVKEAAVLKGRKPYLSPWRGNFRLLTGPFESDAAAQDFVKALKKDGVSSYQWTSPAGQPVDTLALD